MANINTKTLEKNVDNIEDNIEKELKQKLLDLDKEEFKKYFEGLIEKYYSTLFTFDKSYNNYVENSNKKYNAIKKVKSLCSSEYNNLDNYENYLRLVKAEDIAYKQMNELYFMESSYSRIIYYNAIQDLIYFKDTLRILIDVYEETSSEELLSAIGRILKGTILTVKEINKLPLDEASLEFDFKEEEGYYSSTDNIFKYHLIEVKEGFNSIVEELETLVPEDVAEFKAKVNEVKEDILAKSIFETAIKNGYSESEAYDLVAFYKHLRQKNFKGYLYQIIESL